MFYVFIKSFWKALTALKGKERVFVGLNHSFIFTLKMGGRNGCHTTFCVRKYFPSFDQFVFSSCLLKGCQGDKLPIIRAVYKVLFRTQASKTLDGWFADNLSAPGATWLLLYMCRWCPHPHSSRVRFKIVAARVESPVTQLRENLCCTCNNPNGKIVCELATFCVELVRVF